MMLSREFDRRAAMCYRQGGAWFHISSAGHEGLAVLAGLLDARDVIAPHYRDRALLLARGMEPADMVHDLLATDGGDAGGRNMTSHFSCRALNVLSVASPVAGNCLPAAGMAWAARLEGRDSVVVCLVGDASTRQGEFFESLAFAVERALPVVFVVEDNKYGISTPTRLTSPARLGLLGKNVLVEVDGSDVDELEQAARTVIGAARRGEGPSVLWCSMDRLDSHTSADDQRLYRDAGELAELKDPIEVLTGRLLAEGALDERALESMRAEVVAEVEQVFTAGKSVPRPRAETVLDEMFAAPQDEPGTLPDGAETMVDAVNSTLADLLRDPRTVVFGQDVEDPKGGVFGLTRGLSATGRVFNAPLAEATIVGVGVGLAAAGLRPVVELQFVDFAGPAWNQITAQMATLRWRTRGAWTCPLVVYAPSGAYLPGGGIWHSQSNESLFTHVPGLRVAVPSTPQDAHLALAAAAASGDPSFVLLPKHLLRRRTVPGPARAPGARTIRSGADVTVVAWGNTVELAVGAAEELAGSGADAEVIDLCWLNPCDIETVHRSVRKTGRLVVVQEDVAASSFGAGLLAELAGDEETFYRLLAPPRLVSRLPVHVPYDTGLEQAVLPNAASIGAEIRAVLA